MVERGQFPIDRSSPKTFHPEKAIRDALQPQLRRTLIKR